MTTANTIEEIRVEIKKLNLTASLKIYAKELGKQTNHLGKDELLTVLNRKPIKGSLTFDEQVVETVAHNHTQVMCIVTDRYVATQYEEEIVGRVFPCSWGNKLGSQTERVKLDGEPQYLFNGTINKLRKIPLASFLKDANGKENPKLGTNRFQVTIIDGWTDEELAAQRKKQALTKIK